MIVLRRRKHPKLRCFFLPPKPIFPFHQPHLSFPPKLIFNTHVNYSSSSPSSSTNQNEVIYRLTTIFTKRLYIQNKEELHILGQKLNPALVETVLKGFKSWRIANDFFLWASEQNGYAHNCYTYNAMASIHSKFQKTTRLRFLAIEVVNKRCQMTPGALGFFIRCLSGHGLVDEAVYLFEQFKRLKLCVLNSYTYNCLIEAAAKSGRFELVEMRLREMKEEGLEADKYTFTPILQAYCNAKMFEEALILFNQIFDRGLVDEHIFTILMISFSKWGEVDKAFDLLERMEALNMSPTEKTLCSLIHGFTKESRVDKALQLFDKMRILAFNPDLPLYSVLIEGLCKKKEVDKALRLYTEMKRFGIVADAYVLKNLISSFCAEGDLVTADKLFKEGEEDLGLEARVMLYNFVLEGLVSNGFPDKAYFLIQGMMGIKGTGEGATDDLFTVNEIIFPNFASFSVVIDGLCKTEKLDESLILFREMIHMGLERSVLWYNNLISALCNTNRLEESLELFGEMKRSGYKATEFTHNCLFGCLCRRGNISPVLDLMREMRVCGHEPWVKHYSGLVKQLCSNGDTVKACKFLAEMAQEGFLPDVIAYTVAIDGLFKIREVERAIELFHCIAIRGHGPDVVAYNIVIDGLCKVGKVLEGRKYLIEMLKKGLLPSVVTYNSLIDGLCKANELDQAFHCFREMIGEEREPTVVTYTTLVDGLCNASRPDEALVLWNEMSEKRCSPNRISYMALINGLCKCSRSNLAKVYFDEMKEKEMRPDTYVYVGLIHSLTSSGDFLLAFEVLKELVQKEEFPVPPDKNYSIMIEALIKLSENSSTSLGVRNLVAEGSIAAISSVYDGVRDGLDPIG